MSFEASKEFPRTHCTRRPGALRPTHNYTPKVAHAPVRLLRREALSPGGKLLGLIPCLIKRDDSVRGFLQVHLRRLWNRGFAGFQAFVSLENQRLGRRKLLSP